MYSQGVPCTGEHLIDPTGLQAASANPGCSSLCAKAPPNLSAARARGASALLEKVPCKVADSKACYEDRCLGQDLNHEPSLTFPLGSLHSSSQRSSCPREVGGKTSLAAKGSSATGSGSHWTTTRQWRAEREVHILG